jgi:predicted DsbA family dithiol-disulfide isomerase
VTAPRRLVVPVHYDFASSLCYVAHRVLERIGADLDGLGIALAWTPLDLAQLLGHRRGAPMAEDRRANAERVARDLGVPLRIPATWLDSRAWNAAALLAAEAGREQAYREAAWCALFERTSDATPEGVAAECGLALHSTSLAAAIERVAALTEAARDAEVCGVPTFVLGGYPIGGIQSEATMRSMLARFAARNAAVS